MYAVDRKNNCFCPRHFKISLSKQKRLLGSPHKKAGNDKTKNKSKQNVMVSLSYFKLKSTKIIKSPAI